MAEFWTRDGKSKCKNIQTTLLNLSYKICNRNYDLQAKL